MFDAGLPDMSAEDAWTALLKADKERDLDDVLEVSAVSLVHENIDRNSTSNVMQKPNTSVATQLILLILKLAFVKKNSIPI
jgi:hypothetical protein